VKTKVIPAIILISVVLTFLGSCYIAIYNEKDGNGIVTSQVRSARNFNSVILDGVGDVNIHFAEHYKVIVITDSNIQDIVTVKVNGNNLHIGTRKNNNFNPTTLSIDVYLPELNNVKLRGVGNIAINDEKASHFDIELSGVGNINALNYEVENVSVSLSGVGNIKTWVTKKLTGRISGVGDVIYKGNPSTVDVDTNITGKVKKW